MLVIAGAEDESVFNPSVGTIDYATGTVRFSDITITNFEGNAIKFTANSVRKDIKPPKDRIIVIRGNDISVNVTPLES